MKKIAVKAPAWIEIDTGAIVHNFRKIRSIIDSNCKILGVVKADAYGHGAEEVARILLQEGVDMLGVTSLAEGLVLRKAGIKGRILVFAPLLNEEIKEALKNDLTITVGSLSGLKEISNVASSLEKRAVFHLKIDTGFGRTGVFKEELSDAVSILEKNNFLSLEGIYTHFVMAGNSEYTNTQFSRFKEAINFLADRGIDVSIKHCCNSTAAVLYPEMHLDMVRIGTLIYGQQPASLKLDIELESPWKVKTRILSIKRLPKGHYVGYGGDYKTKKESDIAIIPVGYEHGYAVTPNIKPKSIPELVKILLKDILSYFGVGPRANIVYIKGRQARVVGRIGMQLSMVDVTDISGVEVGEEVTVPLRRVTASYKLPRVYVREGSVYKIRYSHGEEYNVEKELYRREGDY